MTFVPSLVSTIIPVFNRPDLLREAVGSVLAQTYRPIEVVVVDDGSTDSTPAVCVELTVAHPEVSFARVPNGGPGQAREVGRLRARGEFIQYLDSDDLLHPLKFVRQIEALRRSPECGIAYCKTREYLHDKPRDWWPSVDADEELSTLFPFLLLGRRWQTASPLFRKQVTDAVGPWAPLWQEEDWEYDSRAAALGTKLVRCSEFLAEHRHHTGRRAGGDSFGSPQKMRWRFEAHRRIYDHALKFGIGPSDPHMQHFARELFLLARQCGASGLARESRELFRLALEASGPERATAWDFSLYEWVARVVGWSIAGRLACWSDRFRSAEAP